MGTVEPKEEEPVSDEETRQRREPWTALRNFITKRRRQLGGHSGGHAGMAPGVTAQLATPLRDEVPQRGPRLSTLAGLFVRHRLFFFGLHSSHARHLQARVCQPLGAPCSPHTRR